MTTPPPPGNQSPSFAQMRQVFGRIGLMSFGGPAAQIALMHEMLVDQRRWLDEQDFLRGLSFSMLLPGPEAMQLATYAGWRQAGWRGGVLAGGLFVLPGAALIFALTLLYGLYGQTPALAAAFLGIKAAIVIILLMALMRLARKALRRPLHWTLAALAFGGIFLLDLPFPLIVLGAALIGHLLPPEPAKTLDPRPQAPPGWSPLLRAVAIWGGVWLLPLIALMQIDPLMGEIGSFFARLAVVTFGGAYAVLAYMAQDAVGQMGWLSAAEMMDGLGLAETTPGPLILVTEFVGTLAALKAGGPLYALLGALVTLWATFAPCFLWVFAGAPYLGYIARLPRLQGALDAITAAVVGVMLNLGLWFTLQLLFGTVTRTGSGPVQLWVPAPASLDLRVLPLIALAAALMLWRKWEILPSLGLLALAGLGIAGLDPFI